MESGGGSGSVEGRSYLPAEWGNEERMRVLMGAMPAGGQGEVARAARHTFWAAAVQDWCRHTHTPTFTLQECQSAFRRGTQLPQCLPEVLQLMVRQGEVVPLSQLNQGGPEESWLGWGRRVLVSRPSLAVWGQIKRVAGLGDLKGEVLVCRVVMQEICSKILDRIWRNSPSIPSPSGPTLMSLAALYTLVGEVVGAADTLHLAVEVLVGEGRAATLPHHGTIYVKFAMPGDAEKPAITQEELAQHDLQAAKGRVEGRLATLQQERDTLHTLAKTALHRGAKNEALSLLRRRKLLDQSAHKQLGVLENLTCWLTHLQDAQTNRQVLGALKGGVEALRSALAGDASPDAAAATLDDLQEVLEECEDLNTLVTGTPGGEEDLTTLEEELAGLMLAAKGEEEAQLPEVPTSVPFSAAPPHKLPS